MYTKISKIMLIVMACIGFNAEATIGVPPVSFPTALKHYMFFIRMDDVPLEKSVTLPGEGLSLKVLKEALKDKRLPNGHIVERFSKRGLDEGAQIDSDVALEEFLKRYDAPGRKLQMVYITARN